MVRGRWREFWDRSEEWSASDWSGGSRLRFFSAREKALFRGASKVFFTDLNKLCGKCGVRERAVGGDMVGVEA